MDVGTLQPLLEQWPLVLAVMGIVGYFVRELRQQRGEFTTALAAERGELTAEREAFTSAIGETREAFTAALESVQRHCEAHQRELLASVAGARQAIRLAESPGAGRQGGAG